MNKIFIAILILIGVVLCFNSTRLTGEAIQNPSDGINITILYDNYTFIEGTQSDWGFSCLITGTEKTILFDTGTKSDILRHNIDILGVDITQVDAIVISHNHGDHTGGLLWVMEKISPLVPVYAPTSYLGKQIEEKKDRIIRVTDPVEICGGVHSTGEMGTAIKEQSLILNTARGLVLVTGCAHPGIVDIIEKAESVLDKKVYFAFGGFHLISKPENQIRRIIERFRELGVVQCGATHCTGPEAIGLFKDSYGDKFVDMGVGRTINIERKP
ncbi:MAG: MBL fold metallo-hydrolase [Candidatus Aminicenantes bacterium]